MIIKVKMRNGEVADFNVPDNTNFNVFCLHIMAARYLMSDRFMIPYDWIAAMWVEGPSSISTIVMPGTETKQ